MADKHPNPPAFPQIAFNSDGSTYVHATGVSLRDYFAAQALAANADNDPAEYPHAEVARDCYAYADAMLAERLK